MKPSAEIAACRSSHQRLLAHLAPMTDDDFSTPSLLPGYTRGHVVAHLTNKTNAHVVLVDGAGEGETRQLHPTGYDPDLAADIGARQTADQLRANLQQSFTQLEAAWDALDATLWDRQGIMMAGPRTMTEIIGHHLRNVEVHHVDLDIGYQASDWPALFVDAELAKRVNTLADRADHAHLLAWLLGRAHAPQLAPW